MPRPSQLDHLRELFRHSALDAYPINQCGDGAVQAAVGLMEMAFIEGMKAAEETLAKPGRTKGEVVLPSFALRLPPQPDTISYREMRGNGRALVKRFRRAIFGSSEFRHGRLKQPLPLDLAAVLFPPPYGPDGRRAETWLLPSDPWDAAGVIAMRKFIRLGLAETYLLKEGWALGWLTEWGLELVDYGETPVAEDRPEASRSRTKWVSLMATGTHPALLAARKFGVPGHLIGPAEEAALETIRQRALEATAG